MDAVVYGWAALVVAVFVPAPAGPFLAILPAAACVVRIIRYREARRLFARLAAQVDDEDDGD